MKTKIISAVCSLTNEDGSLHVEGMREHLADQWTHGIAGILVAGTMGRMQMLADRAYQDLVRCAAECSAGRGEIMVGVGDTSLPRTRDRIEFVQQYDVDAVVFLTPGYWQHGQAELIAYYTAVADASEKPVYLYDLPVLTGYAIEIDTVVELSQHPNLCGIKSSTRWDVTRQLFDVLPEDFRIIPAQPFLVDELVREGIESNLDGIYSVFPRCTMGIVAAAEAGDIETARRRQAQLTAALRHLRTRAYSVLGAATAILNHRGIGGRATCLPETLPDEAQAQALLAAPEIQAMLEAESAAKA